MNVSYKLYGTNFKAFFITVHLFFIIDNLFLVTDEKKEINFAENANKNAIPPLLEAFLPSLIPAVLKKTGAIETKKEETDALVWTK